MDKLYLTKEGYQQYLDEVDKLKKKLYDNNAAKKVAYDEAPGDGWHDNFVFEDIVRQENNIITQIESILKIEKNIKIVERKENNNEIVDIGDTIKLQLTYKDGSIEEEIFELNANYKTKHLQEISINSPLGKAIYLKKINSSVSYKANEQDIQVKILEKINNN